MSFNLRLAGGGTLPPPQFDRFPTKQVGVSNPNPVLAQAGPAVVPQRPTPNISGPKVPLPIPTAPVNVPPTGLIGSEQALIQALTGATNVFEQSALQGRQDVNAGVNSALQQLADTTRQVSGAFGSGRSTISGANRAVADQIGQGVSRLDPFVGPGRQANSLQARLSGASGPQAQAQAFADFNDSPGQQFLRDRGEQAVLRNATALGGLGGGRVLQELQRQGIGLAQQDFNNQFNRLGQVSDRGFSAANQIAGLKGTQAGISGQLGAVGAQLDGQEAQSIGNLGQIGAGINVNRGLALSDISGRAGDRIGSSIFNTGQLLSGGRTSAGISLRDDIAGTTSGVSNLINRGGETSADLLGSSTGNLVSLLTGAGSAEGLSQDQLAALLANISTGGASQVAGLPSLPGTQQNPGIIGNIGKAVSAISQASDIRLKTNIRKIGQHIKGYGVYRWDWTVLGGIVAKDQKPIGVLAQEVERIVPDAVHFGTDGFRRVDYGVLANA